MNKKKIIITVVIIIVLIFIIFFIKNNYKKSEFGNNITNKSIEEIENYILNISEYDAELEIEIQSNKNTNKYTVHQIVKDNIYEQEVIKPENIAGVKIIYDGENLTVENTNLGLKKLYEKYNNITDNILWINSFIDDYKNSNESKITIKDDYVVLETKNKNNEEKYNIYKTLYCDKNTLKPVKLEIKDKNKKIRVYISYKEIEINSLQEGILAFKLKNIFYSEY